MSSSPGDRIGNHVVEQACMGWRRRAGSGLAQVLYLNGVPDRRKSAGIRNFSDRDASNRSGRRGFVGRHPGAEEVRNRDGRNDQYDRDYNQQLDQRKSLLVTTPARHVASPLSKVFTCRQRANPQTQQ